MTVHAGLVRNRKIRVAIRAIFAPLVCALRNILINLMRPWVALYSSKRPEFNPGRRVERT